MSTESSSRFEHKTYFACGLLFLLIFCIYSNSLNSTWHLDDYPNIVNNSELHLNDLYPESLYKTFFSHPWPLYNLYRPIPCLTFALNWYAGKDNVVGYHLVNITIHFLSAFFLYLTILNLYRSPNLVNRGLYSPELIALLAATLWAVNPIQTQAVTYIVQRMASMAGLFYILGIFFYVKGRISDGMRTRALFFLGCALSYGLAFGSKENAAALPLALIFAEIIFFQTLTPTKTPKSIRVLAAASGVLLIIAGIMLFIMKDDLSILKGYTHRSFDLSERLLTEPRILIFYLTQLFYPMPHRLSIEHDFAISSTFFEPWTTLPSILLIFLLIGLGFYLIKKRPVLAFSILFFFLNHLIEATILPLELVFEHRNYLPSLFLFWPIAGGMLWVIEYYRQKNRILFKSLVAFATLLVLGLGFATYIRNMDWATERTLWEDAVKKAPGRARPVYNLAKYYYKIGRFEAALELFNKSLSLRDSKPKYSQALALNGMASLYYVQKNYNKVIELCRRALEISPGFEVARFNTALAHVHMGRWDDALESVDLLLAKRKGHAGHQFLKGFILLKQNQPEKALLYLRNALRQTPGDRKTMLNIGKSLSAIREFKKAEWFFKQTVTISPADIQPYLYLIENSLKAGDSVGLEKYSDKLFAAFSVNTVISKLGKHPNDLFLIPPSPELIFPVINAKLKKIADEISGHASR